MSAKPTQFSFPLCRSFPVVSSKFYVVVKYALNIQFALFCQPGGGSRACAKVLTSLTEIIYKWSPPPKVVPPDCLRRIIGPPWDRPRRHAVLTVRGPPSSSLQTVNYEARKHRLESLGRE